MVAAELRWTKYEDAAFSCGLDYRQACLVQKPKSRRAKTLFQSGCGVYFRIQGVENANGWSTQAIKEQYLSAAMPGDVTYDRTRSDFVVLFGTFEKAIVLEREVQ
jgi:hypothetical protein